MTAAPTIVNVGGTSVNIKKANIDDKTGSLIRLTDTKLAFTYFNAQLYRVWPNIVGIIAKAKKIIYSLGAYTLKLVENGIENKAKKNADVE